MNILIVSCVFPPEPVVSASLSFDIATALSVNHNVTVISPKPSRPMGYDTYPKVNKAFSFVHIILPSFTFPKSKLLGRFRESYSFGKASAQYINKNKNNFQVIYINTWPLVAQYLTVKATSKNKIQTVLHIQDIYPEALTQRISFLNIIIKKLLLPIDNYIISRSAVVVTISEGMRKLLLTTRNVTEDKIKVVYNWQDEQKFILEQSVDVQKNIRENFSFMFLGSLGPVANVDNLIRALVLLKNEEICLTIAGEGSEKNKLQKLAQDLHAKSVVFMQASASEAGKIQATADILMLSLKKGAAGLALPSKLPAYMFSAKPIIATVDQDSDTANAIREAGCGWVIEPENPSELADLMQKVSLMPMDELERMGMKGREYALKHFSKQANLPKLVSIIEDAIMQ